MVFSSPLFLFLFLPLVICGYYLMPRALKNFFLLISSFCFYLYGASDFALILFVSILVDYILSRFLRKKKVGKTLFVIGIVLNLGLLAYFKYANFFVHEIAPALGLRDKLWVEVVLPLGISFFVFHKISYLADVYKGTVAAMKNPLNHALYIVLFPQLIAGPIIRYSQIADQIKKRVHSFDKFFEGVYIFALGIAMKVLMADPLGGLYKDIFSAVHLGSLMTFVGILAYSFQIYLDFAGYSKMAIGMGKMFGFDFPENFNRPYLSCSITEFWRRWHMTLSAFFREYVYFPLGGNRVGKLKMARNLFFVFLLTGIWHGANWTFFLWGIYFGVLIVAEKFFLLKILEKIPTYIARAITFFLVSLGWILFQAPQISTAFATIGNIFSFSGGYEIPVLGFNFKSELLLILSCMICFIPFDFQALKKVEANTIFRIFLIVVFLFASFISVAGDTFHPFLYFKF